MNCTCCQIHKVPQEKDDLESRLLRKFHPYGNHGTLVDDGNRTDFLDFIREEGERRYREGAKAERLNHLN